MVWMTDDKKILHFFIGMFLFSLLVSMAGIEIFSGCIMATLLVIYSRHRWGNLSRASLNYPKAIGLEWAIVSLVVVATVGLILHNDYNPDRIREFTPLRWVFLLYALTFALYYVGFQKQDLWLERFFLITTAIGLYALFEAETGMDLIRSDNRAVQIDSVWRFPYFRASGFFSNPMTYGHSSAMWICLSLAFLLFHFKKKKWIWLGGISVLCLLLGLFSSYTRGAWIAAFFGLLTVAIFKNWKLGLGFILLSLLGGGALAFIFPQFGERLMSIFDFNFTSNLSRLYIWKAHFAIFKDYPLLGSGINYNPYLLDDYYERLEVPIKFRQIGHAHNTYLQWLAGTGIFGFLAYMAFILSAWLLSLREYFKCNSKEVFKKSLLLGVVGGQMAFHFGGLTECNFRDAEVKTFFLTLIAIALAVRLQRKDSEAKL